MTKLFIEGYELDLSKGLSNQITYAIDDLYNLDSKATTFSKTIVLPGTSNNNKLLGNIFEFNNANFTNENAPNVFYNYNASKSAKCRIEVDGLQIVKGVFRLLEIIRDGQSVEYECAVFGELGGLVTALGNKRLEDLDFSAYNHNYTYANIVASWNNITSTSYVYPLIDYGNYSIDKKNFQYKTFRPALFLKEYFDKIIASAGYTYTSTFLNTPFFKRLIIPCNQKVLTKISSTGFDVSFSGNQNYGSTGTGGPLFQVFLEQPLQNTLGLFTTADNRRYTYTGAVTLVGTLKVSVTGEFENPIVNNLTIGVKCGSAYTFYEFPMDDGFGTNDPFNITLNLNVGLNTGDIFYLEAYNRDSDWPFQLNITSISSIITSASNQPVPLNLGELVIINDTIPKGIFQKDLFTSILKMFNLIAVEDKFTEKHLNIEPYIDFYTGNVVDWSDKLDRGKPIRLKPMSEANARYYELKWKQDNDFYNEDYRKKYNEGYGDRIFDNGLEFSKDKETVDVIFAATPLYGVTGEDKVYPGIYKKSDNNTKEDQVEHVVRLMQIKKITDVASWNILNGASNLGSNTTYLYAGHLDDPDAPNADLNFGATKELYFELATGNLSNNLSNVFYTPYLAEITDKDSRLLTAYFKLNQLDIFNIDFSKFIYIDGGVYRLCRVIDYTAETNDVTKCELLRVINKVY